MDSEHRHELKQNELANWIANAPEHIRNLPQYIKKNPWESICIVLIIIGCIGFIRGFFKDKSVLSSKDIANQAVMTVEYKKAAAAQFAAREGKDAAGVLLEIATDIESKINTLTADTQKALAYVKAGDALRADLHFRKGNVSQEAAAGQIELAKEKYQKALELAGKDVSMKALAKFGIALCSEEVRDFDAAKAAYAEIIADETLKATPIITLAKTRLETISDSEEVFEFQAAPAEQAPAQDVTAEQAN